MTNPEAVAALDLLGSLEETLRIEYGHEPHRTPAACAVCRLLIALRRNLTNAARDEGLLELLRELEFIYIGQIDSRDVPECPICHVGAGYKHKHDCRLARALAGVSGG